MITNYPTETIDSILESGFKAPKDHPYYKKDFRIIDLYAPIAAGKSKIIQDAAERYPNDITVVDCYSRHHLEWFHTLAPYLSGTIIFDNMHVLPYEPNIQQKVIEPGLHKNPQLNAIFVDQMPTPLYFYQLRERTKVAFLETFIQPEDYKVSLNEALQTIPWNSNGVYDKVFEYFIQTNNHPGGIGPIRNYLNTFDYNLKTGQVIECITKAAHMGLVQLRWIKECENERHHVDGFELTPFVAKALL
jgi:hypothetical protein